MPGSAFWTPKGTTLYQTLSSFMRGKLLSNGYVEECAREEPGTLSFTFLLDEQDEDRCPHEPVEDDQDPQKDVSDRQRGGIVWRHRRCTPTTRNIDKRYMIYRYS